MQLMQTLLALLLYLGHRGYLGMLVCSVRSLNLVADPNPHAKYLVSVSILLGAIFIFIVLAVRQATQM